MVKKKRLKSVIVYDSDDFELIPFQEGVNSSASTHFELYQRPENINLNKHRSGKKDELKRYYNYFKGGYWLYKHRNEYENIICWQQFYALTYGFFCSIFHKKNSCCTIACNYTYKGKNGIIKKLYYWFMKKCLSGGGVSYIHILSDLYADRVCSELSFDRQKTIITSFGILDEYDKYSELDPPKGYKNNGYFLAIGRSNRDYDFLMDVWKKIDYPLVIVSDKYNKESDNPNVIIRRDVGAEDQYNWISNCRANVLCLDDGNIASGDTVLLSAMSLSKINIVSRPSTLAEMYIENRENGLLVDKDIDIFREVIGDVLDGKYDYISKNARNSFLERFSRKSMGELIGKYI